MASIFSAKNETILALANANVEFSLVKLDVKKEYEGLGKALSTRRLENAETGAQHRTARRLSALFEEIIPDIDDLETAYAKRVSEIALASRLNINPGSPTMASQFGPFAGHAGVDGTSIYAAASSGGRVIALHLLACMLAKVFSSTEATAIWVQLVEGRLVEMKERARTVQISGLIANIVVPLCEQISRDDLAVWDASARAWLEVANTVKRKEDTQAKLIFQNLPSIQSSKKTNASILENWIIAMTTLQKSIQGVPQEISNGAVLLGITAWHIYPDIFVFGPIRHINFNDPLVRHGGKISLGLERNTDIGNGVSWSVSLSHLRYYGEPVAIERSPSLDTDRITSQELLYVTLGCVISSWSDASSFDIVEVSECLKALGNCIGMTGDAYVSYQSDIGWLAPLIAAAENLLLSQNDDRDNALYFIEFGRRRGRRFLDDSFRDVIPMFGLLNPYQLFRVSHEFKRRDQEVEHSIGIYRQLARDCGFDKDDCIIISSPLVTANSAKKEELSVFDGHWEVASAIPLPCSTGKHSEDGTLRITNRHVRWIHVDRTKEPALQRFVYRRDFHSPESSNMVDPWSEEFSDHSYSVIDRQLACKCRKDNLQCGMGCTCRMQGQNCTSLCSCVAGFTGIEESLHCWNIRDCKIGYDVPQEDCFWLSLRGTISIDDWASVQNHSFHWQDPPNGFQARYDSLEQDPVLDTFFCQWQDSPEPTKKKFHFGFGEPQNIYRMNSIGGEIKFRPVHTQKRVGLFITDRALVKIPPTTISQLKTAFLSGNISPELLKSHLSQVGRHGVKDYSKTLDGTDCIGRVFFRSLCAISAISELYRSWSDAKIQISITKRPLGDAHWARNLVLESCDLSSKLDGQTKATVSKIHRSTKFACLVMLESGGIDIHPDQLELVMGMATGNSIYAAEYLLQDPSIADRSGQKEFIGIRRIFGSLGEPGIVCLVPPPLAMRENFHGVLHRLVQHKKFDGNLVDLFDQSSLHLRLTALKVPLVAEQGAIGADVMIREALIQVFDGSRWVADLDILKGIENPKFIPLLGCSCPNAEHWLSLGEQLSKGFGEKLKSISKWEELLLCHENLLPDEIGGVCASGNWYVRLAATVLALSMNCSTAILPCDRVCERCAKRLISWRPSEPLNNSDVLSIIVL